MAFGVEVIGNDAAGTFTVADTDRGLLGYAVSIQGAGSSVTISGASKQPLVFVNAKGVTAADTDGIIAVWNNSNKTYYFYSGSIVYEANSTDADVILTARSVNYFIAQSMDEISPDGTQGYGIQLKNANGDVALDSRSFPITETFYLPRIVPPRTVETGQRISSDSTDYVEMSHTSYGDFNTGYYYTSAVFHSNKITYKGKFGAYVTILGANYFTEAELENMSTIIIGQLR